MQNNGFSTNKTWNVSGTLIDFVTPKVMGILNITPDSFYEGSRLSEPSDALKRAEIMLRDGADFIDVGGYSSRPGATDISESEEIRRVVPVVREISRQFSGASISIDTFRSAVAAAALDAGAQIINDISGGELDPQLPALAATRKAPYIIMHMRGTPQTMQQMTDYHDLLTDVTGFLQKKVHLFQSLGIKDVAIDPGFGFAKTIEQNFHLLRHLEVVKMVGQPIMVGVSRKSMIWKTLGITSAEALNGTTALHMLALSKGANILRVHDVKEAKECITLFAKLNKTSS